MSCLVSNPIAELLSVKTFTSGPDGLFGNSWPISVAVCLDWGFSTLRWLFRSDKYNVVGDEKRDCSEITFGCS